MYTVTGTLFSGSIILQTEQRTYSMLECNSDHDAKVLFLENVDIMPKGRAMFDHNVGNVWLYSGQVVHLMIVVVWTYNEREETLYCSANM